MLLLIASTVEKVVESCSWLRPPGFDRYRSITPSAMAPIRTGKANTARTPARSASSRKTGHRLATPSDGSRRSETSTGTPDAAASMQGPSPRVNWRSSMTAATRLVAWRARGVPAFVRAERPQPSTPAPRTDVRQSRSTLRLAADLGGDVPPSVALTSPPVVSRSCRTTGSGVATTSSEQDTARGRGCRRGRTGSSLARAPPGPRDRDSCRNGRAANVNAGRSHTHTWSAAATNVANARDFVALRLAEHGLDSAVP